MRFLGLALRLELVQVSEHGVELLARRGEVLLVVEERRLLAGLQVEFGAAILRLEHRVAVHDHAGRVRRR